MYFAKDMTEPVSTLAYDDAEPLLAGLTAVAAEQDDAELEAEIEAVRDSLKPPGMREAWLAWFIPMAALEGCWLDRAVTIGNAHTGLGSGLLNLQRAFILDARQDRGGGLCCAWEKAPGFEEDIGWLTALARRGMRFSAAVVGVTLAHAELNGGLFALGKEPDYSRTLKLSRELLTAWPEKGDEWVQAMSARTLYRQRTHAWCRAWIARTCPEQRILAMLRSKAKYAQGYHSRIKIGDRSLDDWLGELAAGGGEAFLRSFLDSPYVDLHNPATSRFLEYSTAFAGPMFGVFSEQERKMLQQWFETSTEPACERKLVEKPELPRGDEPNPVPAAVRHSGQVRLKPPQLYHRLINDSDSALTLPAARRLVDRVLARARWLRKGYFPYSPKRFSDYVDHLHEEACRARSKSGFQPTLSRAAYVWGIEQFAPTILVDGCWLQHSLCVAREMPAVGGSLWQIWRDELGDGRILWHHGNVYRRLMESVGIDLPAFESEAFIKHSRFITGAFDLPAFLLAIGRFPELYLPEILGLNLAIELSGLGQPYQKLTAGMESVGLDATIVRLHQSIDNLACGHAALARDSIIGYLNRFEAGGDSAVASQWQRIWTGWRALTPASLRFVSHLLAGWVGRFGVAALFSDPP